MSAGAPRVALVGLDLLAESRVREAVARLGGEVSRHEHPPRDADLVVIDLEAAPDASAPAGIRTVGIYPHVRTDLAERARRAGIEAVPRNRFFRDMDAVLAGLSPR